MILYFEQRVSQEYGILAAAILTDIKILCDMHQRNNTDFYDGRFWCFESVQSMIDKYGESRRQVEKALNKLIDDEMLYVGMYGSGLKRSKWYSLTSKALAYFGDAPVDEDSPHLHAVSKSISSQCVNPFHHSEQMHLTAVSKSISSQCVNTVYPTINQSINQNINPSSSYAKAQDIPVGDEEEKKIYNLILREGDFYGVTNTQLSRYRELYPDIDIDREMLSMTAWLEANQDKRRTKQDMPRFIDSWIRRAQQKQHEHKYDYDKKENVKDGSSSLEEYYRRFEQAL